jgi:hypothetical protein
MFMVSLCLQGISFVDLLYLRKGDLQGELLTYSRRKTGAQVCVYVLDEAREYLSRLVDDREDTLYLLPFITRTGEAGYKQYQSALHRFNEQLKDLAAHLGIRETLTSYVARHTWATMAYHNGVKVSLVSQAMGHSTEEMTYTYLSSFDREEIKGANQAVLDAVLRPIREGSVTGVREEVLRRVEKPVQANVQAQQPCVRPKRQAEPEPEYQGINEGRRGKGIPSIAYTQPERSVWIPVWTPTEPEEKECCNRAERRRREKEQKKEREKQEKWTRRKERKTSVF